MIKKKKNLKLTHFDTKTVECRLIKNHYSLPLLMFFFLKNNFRKLTHMTAKSFNSKNIYKYNILNIVLYFLIFMISNFVSKN